MYSVSITFNQIVHACITRRVAQRKLQIAGIHKNIVDAIARQRAARAKLEADPRNNLLFASNLHELEQDNESLAFDRIIPDRTLRLKFVELYRQRPYQTMSLLSFHAPFAPAPPSGFDRGDLDAACELLEQMVDQGARLVCNHYELGPGNLAQVSSITFHNQNYHAFFSIT
jgi:hypothetical protein